ncbi:MAG: DJ-1 family glyoxalase III [Acidithiobacillus sp.]
MAAAAQVVIPVADGFEDMEVVICCDILRRAGLTVILTALRPGQVTGGRGLCLQPDAIWDDMATADIDLILLPGGMGGVENLARHAPLLKLLQHRMQQGKLIAALCAAPGLLATQGLLDGRRVTAYPGVLDPFSSQYHYEETPVVVDGPLITSRGPGTAMDFALTLVEMLLGPDKRQEIEAPLQRSPS